MTGKVIPEEIINYEGNSVSTSNDIREVNTETTVYDDDSDYLQFARFWKIKYRPVELKANLSASIAGSGTYYSSSANVELEGKTSNRSVCLIQVRCFGSSTNQESYTNTYVTYGTIFDGDLSISSLCSGKTKPDNNGRVYCIKDDWVENCSDYFNWTTNSISDGEQVKVRITAGVSSVDSGSFTSGNATIENPQLILHEWVWYPDETYEYEDF